MTLPAIPSQLVGRDYLTVGGGYGTVAAGTSPAGGMSVDNAGHAALNGDFTIDGALSVGGLVKQWERYVSAVVGMADLTNTPVGPVQTAWGTRISTHTIDYHPTTFKDAHFRIALPASYDGRALAFQLLWGAQAGTAGGVVRWEIRGYCLAHGANLAETAAPSTIVDDVCDGLNQMHVVSLTHTPHNAANGGLLSVLVRRRAADAEDTFNDYAKLIGMRIAYT